MELGASVSPTNLPIVYAALNEEIEKLCREAPSVKEWDRLLNRWHNRLISSLDSPAEMMERYGADTLIDTVEPLAKTWKSVSSIDRTTLPALARKILTNENRVTILVGPNAKQHMEKLKKEFGAE